MPGREPSTEAINERTRDFDLRPLLDQARLMNAEDQSVPAAVEAVLPQIVDAVTRIAQALRRGGRLLYVGAGTSGRVAALDAAECPPTFGTDPDQVQAVLAGGPRALTEGVEGAEDDERAGEREMDARAAGPKDVIVGIAASGTTPFVLAAVRRARARGATTIAVTCVADSPLASACDLAIVPLVGPEVIAGSTRLKAGTAQKLVLNMLSTLAMVQLGKVYGNLMVDLRATNEKLRRRAVRIVAAAAGVAEPHAADALARAGGRVPVAIVMLAASTTAEEAAARLARAQGSIRRAVAGADRGTP
ncbi:MAG TPA: N-acetylmuramic acid 6-phosphate etherase [bacterium]|nr:N-acetylmuramic acid 6-phosphate etherase [bacterium]